MKEAVSEMILSKGILDGNLISFQIPRCRKWAKSSCLDMFDSMNCEAATSFCFTELIEPFFKTGACSSVSYGRRTKPNFFSFLLQEEIHTTSA